MSLDGTTVVGLPKCSSAPSSPRCNWLSDAHRRPRPVVGRSTEIARLARDFRALRDVELALHVPVVGDAVAPFMAPPDTDPVALRAIDSLAILPADPSAATEQIQRRREEIGFSYFVFGAGSADTLAPVVAALAGH